MIMKRYSSTTRVSSRRSSPNKKRIGVVVIVGGILILLLWFVPFVLGFFASLIITPIQATQSWLAESTSNLPHYFRDRGALIAENTKLQEELALRGGVEHSNSLLSEENEELRSLLGDNTEERIMAGVIGRPNRLPYDVLVIDQGSLDGIVVNAPVFVGSSRVIGHVVSTFPNSAVVELVTSPRFVSSVYIVGPDIYTNATGMGGGQLRVGVPQGIELAVGNQVILPSVESGLFGTINHVESSPTGPEQYGFVSTDIPLQSLHFVSVSKTAMRQVSFEEAQQHVENSLKTLFQVPVPEGILVVTNSTSTATTTEEVAPDEETDL